MKIGVLFFVATALMAGLAFGEPTASTAYVLSERGLHGSSLANLSISSDGAVTGTQVIASGGGAVTYGVQGTFTTNDDGSKVLALTLTSTDAVDLNGDPLVLSESVKLMAHPGGGLIGLRTDPGAYAYAELTPAAAAPAPGSYVVTGKAIDSASMCLDMVSLDAAGNISGKRLQKAVGETTEKAFSGSYVAGANGFYTIRIEVASTDADGNAVTETESYLAAATSKDLRMIRVDKNPALLILTR